MEILLPLGLFAPLASSFFLLLFGNAIGRIATGIIACTSILFSFICFGILFIAMPGSAHIDLTLFRWIPVPSLTTDFALHLDALSTLMTLIITGVGFLIHVYSNGYMEHDRDYARFFTCLNFFVFAMLLLVLASNLVLLFVGWEGVGLASYLLIGFWYQTPSFAQSATKAFVVNRIGDLGFLLGILLTFVLFGTSDIAVVNAQVKEQFAVGAPILVVLTLLYLCGAVGKSAQLPLQVWLPDAMAGPTPVSALIHAATMVTAGVYLVVRMHPVYEMAPISMTVVGGVGAVTSLFAALAAVGQTDLKRVLAYSTVSQLGFMFLAAGVGAYFAAMFHLTMHAFMKGLLFLAAGNVVHMMHDTTEMEKMGGLRSIFKFTHIFFFIGVLAMGGIPPLAAFFSKDLILEETSRAHYITYYGIAMTAAFLTAFYLTRAYCLTFTGESHITDEQRRTLTEAPSIMVIPVAILALLSLCGGFLGFAIGAPPAFEVYLSHVGVGYAFKEFDTGYHWTWEVTLSTILAVGGVLSAALIYTQIIHKATQTLAVLKKAFYIDEIYNAVVVYPLKRIAQLFASLVEPLFFEGSVMTTAYAARDAGGLLQRVQSGQLRSYIAWMAIGSVLIILLLLL